MTMSINLTYLLTSDLFAALFLLEPQMGFMTTEVQYYIISLYVCLMVLQFFQLFDAVYVSTLEGQDAVSLAFGPRNIHSSTVLSNYANCASEILIG